MFKSVPQNTCFKTIVVAITMSPPLVDSPSRSGAADFLATPVPGRHPPRVSSMSSHTTERTTDSSKTSGLGSPTLSQRIMSIDALRGMDMFFIVGMEEVFEALSEMFPMSPSLNDRLQHAPWAGFHFYDLIFPLFAFIIGVSLVFSLSKSVATEGKAEASLKILKRSLILFILGILTYGGIEGGIQHVRILGVLQRLALCFCAAGLAFVWMSPRKLVALTVSSNWSWTEFSFFVSSSLRPANSSVILSSNLLIARKPSTASVRLPARS